jgi:hypothetical protein
MLSMSRWIHMYSMEFWVRWDRADVAELWGEVETEEEGMMR